MQVLKTLMCESFVWQLLAVCDRGLVHILSTGGWHFFFLFAILYPLLHENPISLAFLKLLLEPNSAKKLKDKLFEMMCCTRVLAVLLIAYSCLDLF